MISIQQYQSPVGELILGDYTGKLVLCDWKYRQMRESIDKRLQTQLNSNYTERSTNLTEACIQQLEAYFSGERKKFDLPIQFVGTDFQQQVWKELQRIPYGETTTYLKLSKSMNNEKAIRAVASANGANAISIIIPCHRVIGTNNELTGYAGGLAAKKKLLKLEKCPGFSSQLNLF